MQRLIKELAKNPAGKKEQEIIRDLQKKVKKQEAKERNERDLLMLLGIIFILFVLYSCS